MRLEQFCKARFLDIPADKWEGLKQEARRCPKQKDAIARELAELAGRYPFPAPVISEKDARRDFELLDEWDSSSIVSDASCRGSYKYPISNIAAPYSLRGNKAASRFFFEQIIRAAHKEHSSPLDSWSDSDQRRSIFMSALNIQPYVSESTIFSSIRVRKHVVSNFRPSAARHVIDALGNGGTVLDFSAGFGGRFTGFWASSAQHYIGIDPNVALCPCFEGLAAMLRREFPRPKTWEMHYRPAEEVCFEGWRETVDLIFTSPPYFDIERYTSDDSQSWRRYGTQEDWLSGFLFSVLSNALTCLKRGGFLAINIADSDSNRVHVCERMCGWLKEQGLVMLPAWKLLLTSMPGNRHFNCGTGRIAEPIWVFRK